MLKTKSACGFKQVNQNLVSIILSPCHNRTKIIYFFYVLVLSDEEEWTDDDGDEEMDGEVLDDADENMVEDNNLDVDDLENKPGKT